jgi:hypothetical protein
VIKRAELSQKLVKTALLEDQLETIIGPDPGKKKVESASKAYSLFVKILHDTGKIAIQRIAELERDEAENRVSPTGDNVRKLEGYVAIFR